MTSWKILRFNRHVSRTNANSMPQWLFSLHHRALICFISTSTSLLLLLYRAGALSSNRRITAG